MTGWRGSPSRTRWLLAQRPLPISTIARKPDGRNDSIAMANRLPPPDVERFRASAFSISGATCSMPTYHDSRVPVSMRCGSRGPDSAPRGVNVVPLGACSDQLCMVTGILPVEVTCTRSRESCSGVFKTKVVTRGVDVTVNAFYRHSRLKQYHLKDGRALRVETVINSPTDLRVGRRLTNLDELQDKARAINARLLDAERVGQGCVLASPAFARVTHPTVEDGRRAPALRFGDPRVMALPAPWPPTCTPSPVCPTGASAPS